MTTILYIYLIIGFLHSAYTYGVYNAHHLAFGPLLGYIHVMIGVGILWPLVWVWFLYCDITEPKEKK